MLKFDVYDLGREDRVERSHASFELQSEIDIVCDVDSIRAEAPAQLFIREDLG